MRRSLSSNLTHRFTVTLFTVTLTFGLSTRRETYAHVLSNFGCSPQKREGFYVCKKYSKLRILVDVSIPLIPFCKDVNSNFINVVQIQRDVTYLMSTTVTYLYPSFCL